jgi:outer membrane autotransporter protein
LDGINESNPYYADHQGQAGYNGVSPRSLRALNQLSGISYANIGAASANNVGSINRSIADVLRSDVFKFSFIGNPNNAIRGQAIAPLRYTRWGQLFGIGGSTDSDGNASGYKQSFGGVVAGFDRAMWTGTRVGAWVSAATGDITQKKVNESTDVTNVMVGMYLRQEMYFGYALLSGGFGTDYYKTERKLDTLGYRAKSDFNSYIGTAYLERGIDIPVYYATLQPYVSFQATSIWQEDFKETMRDQTGRYARVGIVGDDTRMESYMTALGARASSQPIPFKWGQIAGTLNAAWYHEFNPDRHEFTGRFANNGNFGSSGSRYTIFAADAKRDWCNVGFGLHMDRNSTRIFLGSDMFLNGNQTLISGGGGVVTSW